MTTTPTLRTLEVSREEWEESVAIASQSTFGLSHPTDGLDSGGMPMFHAVSNAVNEDEGLFSPSQVSSSDPDAAGPGLQQHSTWHDKPSGLVHRSIWGWPIISCYTRTYAIWSLIILFIDLTYSAFVLPISIGFQVWLGAWLLRPCCTGIPWPQLSTGCLPALLHTVSQMHDLVGWNWVWIVDLVAGFFFAAELWLGFHVSYVQACRAVMLYCSQCEPVVDRLLTVASALRGMQIYQAQKREVKEAWHITNFYIRHSSFWQDLITTLIWVMEVSAGVMVSNARAAGNLQSGTLRVPHSPCMQIIMLVVHNATRHGIDDSIIEAFQLLRIIRLVRFLSLLKSLFKITVSAGSGTVVPGLEVCS